MKKAGALFRPFLLDRWGIWRLNRRCNDVACIVNGDAITGAVRGFQDDTIQAVHHFNVTVVDFQFGGRIGGADAYFSAVQVAGAT